ncbi:type II toxin-antitoxin system RelE/ParE family toxin [Lactobacillus sp. M0398]|uniref:type II toxin-antitoxin system RelE/ParE family toxin n=1 Tax=unclassified Lactobacillus TaxID=2620435 RepID=UPI0018DE4800|nr:MULTISPECIES: type II toxin-antitoxin system RelE/ParE family toxin [unclassified Lactobacillus]MBI0120867.1 type II toxin-antitoxin system RelE/ParE family toxin [Lactobacillus sp. M0398]MBI0123014.1 type II toxin-antitoxin system RelE/ParE family toxin [Lactobacillus sp. W8174]MBI0135182.1 type II toxin-antitoxin system RelE/ParE family toxin [Lactobacillus sp. W8173]
MFSLKLSSPSKEYFENLKTYLLAKFGEKVKKEVLAREEEKLENLKSFPYLGIKAAKFSELLNGYYVLIDKYEYIFYRVDEKEKIIYIELILSTKEDLIKKIQNYFH